MVVLGFDPGGEKQFGWCVAKTTASALLSLSASGTASHAAEAIEDALSNIAGIDEVVAAGIDSPLFWVANGDRKADVVVRDGIRQLGAPNAGGTVQNVNSLRGACLVQGVLIAHLLRQKWPQIRITESHPKALLWLLGIANRERRAADVRVGHLSELISCESPCTEHMRDAALGAVAALAMIERRTGWQDLYAQETIAFTPVSAVEYWMPIDDRTES